MYVGVSVLVVSRSAGKHQSFVGDKESLLIFTSKTTKQKKILLSNSFEVNVNQVFLQLVDTSMCIIMKEAC